MRKKQYLILAFIIATIIYAGENNTIETFNLKKLNIKDNWSLSQVTYNDSEQITFFRKNLGVSEISGHTLFNSLVYLTVLYTPADEQGFPSDKDHKKLNDFEEIYISKIEYESNSIHVASVVKNGVYDFLFYVSNPDTFFNSVNENNSKIKSFRVEFELAHDPKWEIYHDFP